VFTAGGIRILASPPQAPRANAICERIIGTLRRELLDRLLIVNEHHLRQVLTGYLQHYSTGRPRRAFGLLTPAQSDACPPERISLAEHLMRRKQVLGGLTHEYYVAALPACTATGKQVTTRIVFPSPTGSRTATHALTRRGANRLSTGPRSSGGNTIGMFPSGGHRWPTREPLFPPMETRCRMCGDRVEIASLSTEFERIAEKTRMCLVFRIAPCEMAAHDAGHGRCRKPIG
jgi:hypothetical protein